VPGAESPPMVVLGIDPGLASTGYGVVARRGDRLVALDGGVIETSADSPRERRLAQLHAEVGALEDLYFGQNARTAFAVGQGRGVAMLAAGQRGVPCASYTPQQVKGAVCGSGRAAKEQVCRMVVALLGLSGETPSEHAADALAVAVCHVNRAPLARALAGATA